MLPLLKDSFFWLGGVHKDSLSPCDNHRYYRLFLWLRRFRCCEGFLLCLIFALRLLSLLIALFLSLKLTQSAHWLHCLHSGCR